jgi:hypothetical protein
MSEDKIIPPDELEGYEVPEGRVLITQVNEDGTQEHIEMDLEKAQLPWGLTTPTVFPGITLKSDIWDRATDAEAVTIEAGMAAQSAKLRNFFASITEIHHSHQMYPFLRGLFVDAFGEARADQLLAPSNQVG